MINFQISAFIAQFFVLVIRNLSEKCLVGLDVLYTCPATAECLMRLKGVLESLKSFSKHKRKNEIKNKIIWTKVLNNNYNFKKYKNKRFIHNIILKTPHLCSDWNNIKIEPKSNYQTSNKELKRFNIEFIVGKLLEEFKDIISSGMHSLRKWSNEKHVIDVIPHKAFKENFRSVPYHKRDEFKKLIQELFDADMIRPSKSNYASPTNLVKKPDNSIRITFDYKKINSYTLKDQYPLPIIPDLMQNFKEARFFSKLDFDSGYFQLQMDEESKKYTAFICEFGFFEWNCMPQGLKNAGASFQREMDNLLREHLGVRACVYMDDIIVYSKTEEDHIKDLKIICNLIRSADLKIKLKKCEFFKNKIEYLGMLIENGTIRPAPSKVEALFNTERPKTMKQLLAFIGLASFFRKFIPDFSEICSPLHRVSSNVKGAKLTWNDDCEKAFQCLRKYLTETEHVLILPDFSKPFKLDTDSSDFGIGSVLSQEMDGEDRPVAYFAKHMSKAERNYSTSEKELLAIVKSIEFFKQYLYGKEFVLVTDHQPLVWLMKMKNPTARLARWLIRIEQYDFKILHKKGKLHGNADGMSRWCTDEGIEEEGDEDFGDININAMSFQRSGPDIEDWNEEWTEIIINLMHFRKVNDDGAQAKDNDIQWAIEVVKEKMRPDNVRKLNKERKTYWKERGNLVLNQDVLWKSGEDAHGEKLYQYVVPKEKRRRVMESLHSSLYSGHLMFDKMVARAREKYFWPGQLKQIQNFVDACDLCQKSNNPRITIRSPLKSIVTSRPLELVTMDFVGPLKKSKNGNLHILVLVDHFSKYVTFYPTIDQKSSTVAHLITDFITKFGIPDVILSDRASDFQSQLIEELYDILDIRRAKTTAWHPECDGETERQNKTLRKMLKCFVNESHDNWETLLPGLSIAYNTSCHATTRYQPFYIMFGRKPKVPSDIFLETPEIVIPVSPDEYADKLNKTLKKA